MPLRSKHDLSEATLEKYRLYEEAVVDSQHEISLIQKFFHEITGKSPHSIREDFCGTFKLSCDWVKKDSKNTAIVFDIFKELKEQFNQSILVVTHDTDFANKTDLVLTRANGTHVAVNYKKAIKDPKFDPQVFPGDSINVKKTWY